MKVFEAGIIKAGGIEAAKLRTALEDIKIESVKVRCISASAITKACSRLHGRGGQEAGFRHAGAGGNRPPFQAKARRRLATPDLQD